MVQIEKSGLSLVQNCVEWRLLARPSLNSGACRQRVKGWGVGERAGMDWAHLKVKARLPGRVSAGPQRSECIHPPFLNAWRLWGLSQHMSAAPGPAWHQTGAKLHQPRCRTARRQEKRWRPRG